MTRAHVKSLLERLNLRVVEEDAHGVYVRRAGVVGHNGGHWYPAKGVPIGATWYEQKWRLEPGGGIAGNSGTWWLVPVKCVDEHPVGPFTTARELEPALRRWRRWEQPVVSTQEVLNA